MTVGEAARIVGCSGATIRTRIAENQISAAKKEDPRAPRGYTWDVTSSADELRAVSVVTRKHTAHTLTQVTSNVIDAIRRRDFWSCVDLAQLMKMSRGTITSWCQREKVHRYSASGSGFMIDSPTAVKCAEYYQAQQPAEPISPVASSPSKILGRLEGIEQKLDRLLAMWES